MTRVEIFETIEGIQEKIIKNRKMAEFIYNINNFHTRITLVKYDKMMKIEKEIEYYFSKGQSDVLQKCQIGKIIKDCKDLELV